MFLSFVFVYLAFSSLTIITRTGFFTQSFWETMVCRDLWPLVFKQKHMFYLCFEARHTRAPMSSSKADGSSSYLMETA